MSSSATKSKSILVVDDEEIIRRLLHRWFTKNGFHVDLAVDGQEAIEKWETGTYDLIVMDLEMPRMTGIEAIERIRGTDPNIPIIVLTGYTTHTHEGKAGLVNKYLIKPVRLNDLEIEVRKLV